MAAAPTIRLRLTRPLRRRVPDHGRGAADDRLPARAPQPRRARELPRRCSPGSGSRRLRRAAQPPFGFAPGSPAASVAAAVQAQLAHRRTAPPARRVPVRARGDDDGLGRSRAGCSPAARFARCARSPPPRAACPARTSASGSRSAGPPTSSRSWPTRSTGCSARLDNAFTSQRHFVANASHELRTPLAIMRTEVDVALADPDAQRVRAAADGRGGARDDRPLRAAAREPADARAQRGRGRARGSRSTSRRSPATASPTCARAPRSSGSRSATSSSRRGRAANRAARADDRQPARQRDPPQRARRLRRGRHARATAGKSVVSVANGGPMIDAGRRAGT